MTTIISSIFACLATLAFAVLFNIRGEKILFAALGGGLSWFMYLLILNLTTSELLAYCVSSLIVGIYSEIMARILKTPVTTFIICGIITLVPGGGMYYTMLESIQGNVQKSLNLGLKTLFIAGAISIGVLLASTLARAITYHSKKNIKFRNQ